MPCSTAGAPPRPDRRRFIAGLTALFVAGPALAAARPLRVVALEYSLVEMLLALGVTPVGAADLKGYKRWVGLGKEQLGHVASVGTRQQPSFEAIVALKPDLILGVDFRHAPLMPLLEKIAPTRLLVSQQRGDGLAIMRDDFARVAGWTGREGEARRVLARLDATLANGRAQLRQRAGRRLGLLQGLAGSPSCWAFAANSLPGGVIRALGMVNAWPEDDAAQGILTVGVEDLLNQPADLATVVDPRADFTRGTLWPKVPALAQGRLVRLAPDTWTFGGPLSAQRLTERLARALV
ncbi:iron-siderophore ABC transporter substrate-binding protein [Crenobacter sp. SG2303]|uniref:Iron-siderophore ABC transporter substrate-binding protein n=1 Tax=Crenobacter oryzisoli TaxID=3056844 RepID=A0ABT7XQW1_9NEIS|nr:iron-siderophore ABC transporter substrate-binding protein [Crenobacter sp. SG2303]MDN0076100.1 iron-siderophore ABC transporter substrate-binding protein [Crenobacter sp. SG2303]